MNTDNSGKLRKTGGERVLGLRVFRKMILLAVWGFLIVGTHDASAAAVAAHVASVKGAATRSTDGLGGEPLRSGSTVRSGTVIAAGAESGVLLRPAPKVSVVIYMATKVRFDGADIDSQGRGSVNLSVMSGRILVVFDQDSEDSQGHGKVKVSITTEQGVIVGSKGTWTVRHDETRTVVAVSQGKTDVSIGGGSSAVGSQVEVPEGSVIWLQKRADGLVEAKVVNTETGAMVVIQPDGTQDTSQKAPPDLLAEARGYLNNSGDSTTSGPLTPSDKGDNPVKPPGNPDFSNPKPVLPVVSADTP